ncbi:unnamed protein product [Effrenium voratum]|nr:unnamed protein product [Effrenium voratum]
MATTVIASCSKPWIWRGAYVKLRVLRAIPFTGWLLAAFYSGLRGGQMLGEATVKISQKWGLTEKLPFGNPEGPSSRMSPTWTRPSAILWPSSASTSSSPTSSCCCPSPWTGSSGP